MENVRKIFSDRTTFTSRDDAVSFLKEVYDTIPGSVHEHIEECNIGAVKFLYDSIHDRGLKNKYVKGIVGLMSDAEYAKCAIPTASELYLPEALTFFKDLSAKPLEEIREIKVCRYTNALYCLINYSGNYIDVFFEFLRSVIQESQDSDERCRAVAILSNKKTDYVLENNEFLFSISFNSGENLRSKLDSIKILNRGIFKKYGDSYSVKLAERYKLSLSRENQILYVKALEEFINGRFDNYLKEIKKILEVED